MRLALLLIPAALAACASGPGWTDKRFSANAVTLDGTIWRVGWSGPSAAMDVFAAHAEPRSERLTGGSNGMAEVKAKAGAGSDAPAAGDPTLAGAEAAIAAADAERTWCRPHGDARGKMPNGRLELADPRFDAEQGVWIFKGRCDFAAEAA